MSRSAGDRAVVEEFMDYPDDRKLADAEPDPVRDEDPFGPWEFVEIWNQCGGYGDECTVGRCTGVDSTCKCCCPVCLGETPEDYGYEGDW